jgi:hypothetical protein
MKREFLFTIWYFKPNGKFYTSADVHWSVRVSGSDGPYMADAVARLRGLRDHESALPGLSGGWDGPIVINCDTGFPCLIPPSLSQARQVV